MFFLFSMCFLLTILYVPACLYLQASVSQPYLSRGPKDESTVGFLPFPISWNYFAEHDFMQFVLWNQWIFWACFFKPTPPHVEGHCSEPLFSTCHLTDLTGNSPQFWKGMRTQFENLWGKVEHRVGLHQGHVDRGSWAKSKHMATLR